MGLERCWLIASWGVCRRLDLAVDHLLRSQGSGIILGRKADLQTTFTSTLLSVKGKTDHA